MKLFTQLKKAQLVILVVCVCVVFSSCIGLMSNFVNINYKRPSLQSLKQKYYSEKNGYDSIGNLSFQILDTYGLNKGIKLNIYHSSIEWSIESGSHFTFEYLDSLSKTEYCNTRVKAIQFYLKKLNSPYVIAYGDAVLVMDKKIQENYKGYRYETYYFVRNGEKCVGDSLYPNVCVNGQRD